jgi:6-phosphogluconolactonase (cycloisomerase 2 family)
MRSLAMAVLTISSLTITWPANADGRDGGDVRGGGAVFVMTNSANPVRGNEVAMYDRAANGDLSLIGFFPTGDLSTGTPQLGSGPAPTAQVFKIASGGSLPLLAANLDGLGSQNSLILSPLKRCLFAVNGGSNSVSSFRVQANGLSLASIEDSGGVLPVSLASHGNILFVLNSGDKGSITGFQVSDFDCTLSPLGQNGTASLNGYTDTFTPPAPGEVLTTPAQISFTPDGALLLVSIKGGDASFNNGSLVALPSGRMLVFPVSGKGRLGQPVVTPFSFANGIGGPFSFVFSSLRTFIIVNANTSTVAAFSIDSRNHLVEIGQPVPIAHFATCWIVRSGNYVYAVSFAAPSGAREILGQGVGLPDLDGAIDGFRIQSNGGVAGPQIVDIAYPPPGPGRTGNHGIDLAAIGNWLYFIQPRIGKIGRLTVQSGGTLSNLVDFSGLDPSLEPFPGLNPGINDFLTRCFLQDPNDPSYSPECRLGSAQGIAGF